MAGPSRIRLYVEKRAKREKVAQAVTDLESELDDEKRRSLRLQRQLDEETSRAARAEKRADMATGELERLETELTVLKEKANASKRRKPRAAESGERVGDGAKVPDSTQRVDGSPTPKRPSRAKPANKRSDTSEDGPAKRAGSSRKRGNVK